MRPPFAWSRSVVPILLLAIMIIVGACDFKVLEPWEPPHWGVSLTLPLVNRTYELSGLVNDSTIFADTTTREIQIEFRGDLDTTEINPDFLEVDLPSSATPSPVNEEVTAPNAADFFTAVEESINVVVALDSLLRSTGQPLFEGLTFPSDFPFTIPQATWNNIVATPPVSPVEEEEGPYEMIDTATVLQDNPFIKAIRYVQLTSTPGVSEFATTVTNSEFPTNVDSIKLELTSGPLFVRHETATLAPGNTFARATDLASEKLGSSISMSFGLELPTVLADVLIPAHTTPQIEFTIRLGIGGVDSLAITTAATSLVRETPPALPLSETSTVQIISGVLRPTADLDTNSISLTGLRNTLPFDVRFQLTFPNFDSPAIGDDSLTFGPYTLSVGQATINQNVNLGGYTFHNPAGDEPVTEFEYEIQADVLEKDLVLPLDGSSLGAFQATITI
ncbi:MAG: hypothetical protein ACETWG_00945, partial [Candidatus Neomarinimicrobiota bacterium]